MKDRVFKYTALQNLVEEIRESTGLGAASLIYSQPFSAGAGPITKAFDSPYLTLFMGDMRWPARFRAKDFVRYIHRTMRHWILEQRDSAPTKLATFRRFLKIIHETWQTNIARIPVFIDARVLLSRNGLPASYDHQALWELKSEAVFFKVYLVSPYSMAETEELIKCAGIFPHRFTAIHANFTPDAMPQVIKTELEILKYVTSFPMMVIPEEDNALAKAFHASFGKTGVLVRARPDSMVRILSKAMAVALNMEDALPPGGHEDIAKSILDAMQEDDEPSARFDRIPRDTRLLPDAPLIGASL